MKYHIIQSTNNNALIGFETNQSPDKGKKIIFSKPNIEEKYAFEIINKRFLGKGRIMIQNSNNTLIIVLRA